MQNIDLIHINFNPEQLFLLNICLAFLMFGIALDIYLGDFKKVLLHPKSPLVGLFSQLILLPIMTLMLIFVLKPPESVAMGMLLVSACPGGNVSNFATHLANGNVALSITMTSIVTLSAIFITPLSFSFFSNFIPSSGSLIQNIQVESVQMFKIIVLLIVLPLIVGMYLNYRFPIFTERIKQPVKWLSIILFLSFIFFAVVNNFDNIIQHIHLVFFIVLLHNGLALTMGYWFARANRLSKFDSKAICLETGIQNSGLGLILIFNFFNGLGGMAIIAAWWGIWHLISSLCLATYWKNKI